MFLKIIARYFNHDDQKSACMIEETFGLTERRI